MNTSYRCYTDLSTYCVRFFMFSWNKLSSDRVSHDLLVHCVVLMVHVAAAGGASVLLRWNEWNRRRRHRRLLRWCKSVCLTITIGRFREVNEGRAPAPSPHMTRCIFFRTFDHRMADGRGLSENAGRECDGPNGKTWKWKTWYCRKSSLYSSEFTVHSYLNITMKSS